MRFLLDNSPERVARAANRHSDLIAGQLLTPLTRYRNHGGTYAIDNGAFSGFDADAFQSLLARESPHRDRCIFVAMPDVVGSGRRTLEIWKYRRSIAPGWPFALVAQDGMEDLEIPWDELKAIFIGGRDPWKDSSASMDIVRTAKTLGKWVHVGRVNDERRFRRFAGVGADSCDGSGVSMFDDHLDSLALKLRKDHATLFDGGQNEM